MRVAQATAAPIAAAPAPAAPAQTATVAPQAAAPADQSAARQMEMGQVLPIAGAGALVLLGLGGLAVAIGRRRRREDDVVAEDEWVADENQAMAEPEPVMAAGPRADWEPPLTPPAAMAVSRPAPRHDPVEDAPTTAIPAGFDLSRFGPHMQAAYRGPTEDNPSLSLRYRLRRAAAMDQRERLHAGAPATRTEERSTGDGFMLRDERSKSDASPEYTR